MTPIRYIGHRTTYREGCYGSGIEFVQDQTINVDDVLATKLLRHPDVYERGDVAEADTTAAAVVAKPNEDDPQQEMRDSIANMDKASLGTFAKTHFNADLDQRKSIGNLRTQVTGLFDQFGLG